MGFRLATYFVLGPRYGRAAEFARALGAFGKHTPSDPCRESESPVWCPLSPPRPWVPIGLSFVLVMIDGYDLFMVSFLAPMISKELHLSLVNMGLVFAAGLAGSMAGGLLMGPAADRVGRRPVLLVTLALAGAGTLLCSQAHSFEALAVLRLLTGFALGGLLATIIPLVAEHV